MTVNFVEFLIICFEYCLYNPNDLRLYRSHLLKHILQKIIHQKKDISTIPSVFTGLIPITSVVND